MIHVHPLATRLLVLRVLWVPSLESTLTFFLFLFFLCLQEAIKNATSYEEIMRLEQQLQSGQIPQTNKQNTDVEMREEDEEEE